MKRVKFNYIFVVQGGQDLCFLEKGLDSGCAHSLFFDDLPYMMHTLTA